MSDATGGAPQAPRGSGEHPICWVEIRSTDLQKAHDFYGTVFGWELSDFGDTFKVHYAPGHLGMGFSKGWRDELPNSLFYIAVPDIDDVVAKVVARGGELVEPKQPIGPDMPNSAIVRNAQGVHLGLFDGAKSPQPYVPAPWTAPEPVEPNTVCSVEIHGGTDLSEAENFYGGLFGWGTASMGPQYMMYDPGAGVGGVFQGHTPQAPVMIYIYVTDVMAALEKIVASGGKQIGEAAAMPGMGMFGYFSDPNGVVLGLIGPAGN
ncbi:MAG: VOC family protein [Planctomycetales bacterium]|nr:VOC family protein [bacterium]UNM08933.1 MAG: VOC family protein [Planctomycetales bacterium]